MFEMLIGLAFSDFIMVDLFFSWSAVSLAFFFRLVWLVFCVGVIIGRVKIAILCF